jgi:hypothetical protein
MVYATDLKPGDLFTNSDSHETINLGIYDKIGDKYVSLDKPEFDTNSRLLFIENHKENINKFIFYSIKHNSYVVFHISCLNMIKKL